MTAAEQGAHSVGAPARISEGLRRFLCGRGTPRKRA